MELLRKAVNAHRAYTDRVREPCPCLLDLWHLPCLSVCPSVPAAKSCSPLAQRPLPCTLYIPILKLEKLRLGSDCPGPRFQVSFWVLCHRARTLRLHTAGHVTAQAAAGSGRPGFPA